MTYARSLGRRAMLERGRPAVTLDRRAASASRATMGQRPRGKPARPGLAGLTITARLGRSSSVAAMALRPGRSGSIGALGGRRSLRGGPGRGDHQVGRARPGRAPPRRSLPASWPAQGGAPAGSPGRPARRVGQRWRRPRRAPGATGRAAAWAARRSAMAGLGRCPGVGNPLQTVMRSLFGRRYLPFTHGVFPVLDIRKPSCQTGGGRFLGQGF